MVRSNVKTLYARRATWYDTIIRSVGYAASRKVILRAIPLELPERPRILDLGAGTGLATEALLERFPNAEIVALDMSLDMLRVYHKKFPHIKIIIGDFNNSQDIQKTLGSFDLVVSTGAVSEYGSYSVAIPFIRGVLKKNGVFLAIGVKRNVVGQLLLKGWQVSPGTGREKIVEACRRIFSSVVLVPVPWYLVPTRITTYILKAVK